MAAGLVTVTLNRDGPQTPWGFRLHGGKDIGFPMVIQRVFLGSPSEGDLQRGDTILRIQGHDTANMTHMEAYDLIKAAGQRLSLLIRRLPGAPQPPVTPTSPVPAGGMHPYAKLLRETEAARTPPKQFAPMSAPLFTPKPLPTSQPIREYCYSPLPTTPLPDIAPLGGYFAHSRKTLADSEIIEYYQEKEKEKEAIVHQGHRTIPLIQPKPKTRHDVPIGSYLRFTHDPNWLKGRSSIQPTSKPASMSHYPTPTYSTIGIDSKRYTRAPTAPMALQFERPLDDSSQLVHHQFNSPLRLYSQRNVSEAIKEQTGVSPAMKLNVSAPTPPGQAAPLSPGTLAPAKAGTKLSNIVDITLSPTFQMIQEEEKRSSSPQPPQQIQTPTMMRRVYQGGPKPFGFDQTNPLGNREVIHQSGSFKYLMSQLTANPEQTA